VAGSLELGGESLGSGATGLVIWLINRCEGVVRVHVTWDMVQWLAFINIIMNIRLPLKAGNFLIS
jgi:hypothetical protein